MGSQRIESEEALREREREREREGGEPKVLLLLQKCFLRSKTEEYLSAVAINDQMARSSLNAKLLSALADGVSVAINRRGYAAAAAQGAVSSAVRGGGGRSGIVKQGEEKGAMKEGSETSSWAPDPVTGYYRPENSAAEIDVAELREMLLNQKTRQH